MLPDDAGRRFAEYARRSHARLSLSLVVKGGQKVQRVALQKCGTQWLVDTVIVGRRQGCV